MKLIDLIPIGKENAITRPDLIHLSGIPDRELRREIEALRMLGHPICNDQNGRGYYLADNAEDLQRWLRQEGSRAWRIVRRNRNISKRFKERSA